MPDGGIGGGGIDEGVLVAVGNAMECDGGGIGLGGTTTNIQQQEVKVIWQKAPHGGPIPRLGGTPGGQKLYHWIPGVGFPISVP